MSNKVLLLRLSLGEEEVINTKKRIRYTLFYVKDNGKWKIVNHHTSELTERNSTATTTMVAPTLTTAKRSSSKLLLSPRHQQRPNRRQSQVEQVVAILLRRQSVTEEGWRKLDLHVKQ